jgi:hypothetical protein
MDYLAHGWSAEEMCRQHPYLTPAEAHAAMAYYYDHAEEIDQEIKIDFLLILFLTLIFILLLISFARFHAAAR